jgi:AraC-like DNA-binding protein
MAICVDTRLVEPDERLEYWSHAAGCLFEPVTILPRLDGPYAGRILAYRLGPVSVSHVTAAPNRCVRSQREVALADPEEVQLHVVLRAQCVVSQERRRSVVGLGDMTSYDSSRPYLIESERPFDLFICSVPKAVLGHRADRICRSTALVLPSATGLSRVLKSFLCGLVRELEQGTVVEDSADLGDCLLSMIRGIYHLPPGTPQDPRPPAAVLLSEIKAFIAVNLGDPALRPETIAQAHFISTRYLHKLFEAEHATVSQWIREQRLAHCRRDLEDQALRGQAVSAIACRWGLRDPSHFSHAFRERYGRSPSEVRQDGAMAPVVGLAGGAPHAPDPRH